MSKYAFGDIAINSTEKKKPEPSDKATYIGLEHLDSGSLTVRRFGADVAPIGDKLVMKKGDVLFGKRRAYQKKVAIAPFDGIFSAHGMVLRPKTEVIDKDFFPLFIASDYFLDAAIRISVGSLSPTINWRDLKVLEFSLPPLDEQRRLAKVLWAALDLKEVYQTLLARCDEMASSRFIEMFGDPDNNTKSFPMTKIGSVAQCVAGATPSTSVKEYWENGTIPWMSSGEVNLGRIFSTEKKITQKGYDSASTHLVPPHTVVVAMAGQGKTRGTVAITEIELCTNQSLCSLVITTQTINPFYLLHFLRTQYENLRNASNGDGGRGGLNLHIIGNYPIILPPLGLQNEFAAFVEQLDKSKVALQKNIDRLDILIKTLLQEHFG